MSSITNPIYNALVGNSPQAQVTPSPSLINPSMAASALAPNPGAGSNPLQAAPMGQAIPRPSQAPVNAAETPQGLRAGAPGGSRPTGTDGLQQLLKTLGIGAGNVNSPQGEDDLSGINEASGSDGSGADWEGN